MVVYIHEILHLARLSVKPLGAYIRGAIIFYKSYIGSLVTIEVWFYCVGSKLASLGTWKGFRLLRRGFA